MPEIAFVDGGNACIIRTPAAELHKIRTAVVAVSGKKIKAVKQKEGYVFVRAQVIEGKLKCRTEMFDSSLDYNGTLEIESPSTVRKLSELAAARKAASMLKGENKFVILDGALETFSSEEKKEMDTLKAEAAARNVRLGAIAKTCSLLTDKGESLIDEIAKIAEGTGCIRIAEGRSESHHAEISVAKLNSNASYLFRFARVSEAETELLKAKTRATATGEIRQMLAAEKALDAHNILDSM